MRLTGVDYKEMAQEDCAGWYRCGYFGQPNGCLFSIFADELIEGGMEECLRLGAGLLREIARVLPSAGSQLVACQKVARASYGKGVLRLSKP